jgi:hypothetical protein
MLPFGTARATRRRATGIAASLAVLGAPSVAHAHGGYEGLFVILGAVFLALPSAIILLAVLFVTARLRNQPDAKPSTSWRWGIAAEVLSILCMIVHPALTLPTVAFQARLMGEVILCWLPLGILGAWSIKRARALRNGERVQPPPKP